MTGKIKPQISKQIKLFQAVHPQHEMSGLKEQIKIRSTITQALLLLKTQQYFQQLTHKFQLQICVLLQTDFFFFCWHCMKNPNCIYHQEAAEQRWVLHIELWFVEEGTEGWKFWCCHLFASCLIFCASGKTSSQLDSPQPEAGVTDTSPSPHTAAALNKEAAGLSFLQWNPTYWIQKAELRLLWDL